jgi:hypothetical protein
MWKGFTLKAIDKVTLNLPDWPALFKKFGAHRGSRGLGPVSVELCCVFAVLPRIPLAWVTAKVNTNERPMLERLVRKLRQGDLLLIDNGFYSWKLFALLRDARCGFVIPLAKNTTPRIVGRLGPHDYLVEVTDSDTGATMVLRLLYVYRRGFRRRRLLTSLLEAQKYSAAELAQLYHRRWDIETFYRDFKETMQARTWHCQTPDTFEKELAMHMIAAVLIRSTMLEAARSRRLPPARLSFARALTEARVFLSRTVAAGRAATADALTEFVSQCTRYVVTVRPGRSFPRDPQEYRAKARGSGRRDRGRHADPAEILHVPVEETLTDTKGMTYALS